MNKPLIGIDLGTTYSLAAVMQAGRPVLIPNAMGQHLTPSAVSIGEDGSLFVGDAAKARAVTHPAATATAFKRDMGTDRCYLLAGKRFTPQSLSSLILASLKADAEALLGITIEEAVITVPAYFGDVQRTATKEAAAIAGLRAERIINEPTAAALAYGLTARTREFSAIVLDLGGGTFDVTVLQVMEGVIEIRSSAGDARLGGEDFDSALVAYAKSRVSAPLDAQGEARMRAACEDAKRRLSKQESARIVMPDIIDTEITRNDADACWVPLLERMRAPIERALRDANMSPEAIDEVLLVGGATRMPCVRSLAARAFGKMPLQHLPPDEAVALGAAIQAALKANDASVEDLVVTDVAPFSIGMETGERRGQHLITGLFTPLIDRGTVIPCSRVERFHPLSEGQRSVEVKVYQGEHSDCAKNQLLGSYSLKLKTGSNVDQSVDVRFTYDINGILEVEMTPVASGKPEAFLVEQRPGSMTSAEIEHARAQMKALKMDPRDKLPNAVALARADAYFLELTGAPRVALGHAIAEFRLVLAGQDDRQIAEARERLIALTSV